MSSISGRLFVENASWEEKLKRHIALRTVLTFCLLAADAAGVCRSPTPATSSPPATPPTRASIRAGRPAPATTNLPNRAPNSARSRPRTSSSNRRRPPQLGLHPVHRQAHEAPGETPVDELKTVRVDLPVGLSVNPGATVRCPLATFEAGASGCPVGSEVGESLVTASLPPLGIPSPPTAPVTEVPVYNVEPEAGRGGPLRPRTGRQRSLPRRRRRLGGRLPRGVHDPRPRGAAGRSRRPAGSARRKRADPEKPPGLRRPLRRRHLPHHAEHLLRSRLCRRLGAGQQPGGPSGHIYSTFLRAESVSEADPNFPEGSSFFESPIPPVSETSGPGTEPKECDSIPYDPAIAVDPGTAQTDSPAGAAVERRGPAPDPRLRRRRRRTGQLARPRRRR